MTDFFDVVLSQRAARSFTPEDVDDATVARILAQGRDDGTFPLVRDARADARSIRAAVGQAFDEQVAGMAPVTADEAAEEVADFVLRAIGYSASPAADVLYSDAFDT